MCTTNSILQGSIHCLHEEVTPQQKAPSGQRAKPLTNFTVSSPLSLHIPSATAGARMFKVNTHVQKSHRMEMHSRRGDTCQLHPRLSNLPHANSTSSSLILRLPLHFPHETKDDSYTKIITWDLREPMNSRIPPLWPHLLAKEYCQFGIWV